MNDSKEKKPAFILIIKQIKSAAQSENMVLLERFCHVLENMEELNSRDATSAVVSLVRIEDDSNASSIKRRLKQCSEQIDPAKKSEEQA